MIPNAVDKQPGKDFASSKQLKNENTVPQEKEEDQTRKRDDKAKLKGILKTTLLNKTTPMETSNSTKSKENRFLKLSKSP